jgi:hypothetical protein
MQIAAEKIQPEEPRQSILPFSIDINDARAFFGYEPKTLKNWIYAGKLRRGKHYQRPTKRKILLLVQPMIEFFKEEDDYDG